MVGFAAFLYVAPFVVIAGGVVLLLAAYVIGQGLWGLVIVAFWPLRLVIELIERKFPSPEQAARDRVID